MGNVLDKQPGHTNIDTYSSIQTAKYIVLDNTASKNGVNEKISFKRLDKLYMPKVSNLCYNIHSL